MLVRASDRVRVGVLIFNTVRLVEAAAKPGAATVTEYVWGGARTVDGLAVKLNTTELEPAGITTDAGAASADGVELDTVTVTG